MVSCCSGDNGGMSVFSETLLPRSFCFNKNIIFRALLIVQLNQSIKVNCIATLVDGTSREGDYYNEAV